MTSSHGAQMETGINLYFRLCIFTKFAKKNCYIWMATCLETDGVADRPELVTIREPFFHHFHLIVHSFAEQDSQWEDSLSPTNPEEKKIQWIGKMSTFLKNQLLWTLSAISNVPNLRFLAWCVLVFAWRGSYFTISSEEAQWKPVQVQGRV